MTSTNNARGVDVTAAKSDPLPKQTRIVGDVDDQQQQQQGRQVGQRRKCLLGSLEEHIRAKRYFVGTCFVLTLLVLRATELGHNGQVQQLGGLVGNATAAATAIMPADIMTQISKVASLLKKVKNLLRVTSSLTESATKNEDYLEHFFEAISSADSNQTINNL
jgi:hypothetical protein